MEQLQSTPSCFWMPMGIRYILNTAFGFTETFMLRINPNENFIWVYVCFTREKSQFTDIILINVTRLCLLNVQFEFYNVYNFGNLVFLFISVLF